MKTIIKTGLAAILLMAISCTKESLNPYSNASIKAEENAAEKTGGHYIGEHFGGGVIFWISKNGLHGLIADTVNLGKATWSNGPNIITGATETAIGTGRSNTKKIISAQAKGRYAALACARYKGSGYTDWFLPSKDELNELNKQKRVIGGLGSWLYWSSSEGNDSNAWSQSFSDLSSYQQDSSKNFIYYVRAVRAY